MNDVKLQEGHPVDENLRPLKIGGKSSSLELADADNGARVRGGLEITGKLSLKTGRISSDDDKDLIIDSDGHIEFDGCAVGFDLVTPTYNATTTAVDFKTGNKQFVTFGAGNITSVAFHFPATSGNFVCLIKQDGTGSRTITNYKAMASDELPASGSAILLFAGGSNPTLTTDANHVDIISMFWDADNEIAYAVASLDFQF